MPAGAALLQGSSDPGQRASAGVCFLLRNNAEPSVFDRKLICGRQISEDRSRKESLHLPG